ncbi:Uncharacterised protein [Streptococcus pneumoniae]|nr:Uncharacterised protein [Streptococcus pneumoniae]
MNPIMIVPKISKPRTPTTKVTINKIIKLILCKYLSLTHPIKKATNGYKNKNPADGPANAPIPPRPPDKTGNPTAASNKKITTLNVPNFLPKMIPAKNIPIFCNTIGTGMIGNGTPGTNPNIHIIAAIKAV